MDALSLPGGVGRSWRRGLLLLWLLSAAGCDDAETADGSEVATLVTSEPGSGGNTVASLPHDDSTLGTSSSLAAIDAAGVTSAVSNDDARVGATVVATWSGENSSWLLVDLADGETIEGSARVVVELDEPDVDCAGGRWPVYILRTSEAVTFEPVAGRAAAGPPDVDELRWSVPVAVAGRDLRIVCPSRDELTATIAAQRAMWTAAAVHDYEFTLHWEVFNLTAGDYRVSVVNGQPGTLTRLDEPVVEPGAPPLDLSDIPTTIDQIFDRLAASLDADRILACYDSQLGYPVDVLIDDILEAEDDELSMAVSELTVAGAPVPSVGCADRTQPTTGSMACDVYVVGADGTIGTTPVRSGVRGFTTVARAELPDEVSAGEAFAVTVPSDSQILTSTAEQFAVVAHRDFVRVFGVTGGTIVAGSVAQTPAENAPATADETTVRLGLTTAVAGGGEVTFPAARFDVVAASTRTAVEVSLQRYESTLDLQNTDGSIIPIRVTCAVDPNVLATVSVS